MTIMIQQINIIIVIITINKNNNNHGLLYIGRKIVKKHSYYTKYQGRHLFSIIFMTSLKT